MISHSEPARREIVNEVTLINESKKPVKDVFLQRISFMPALRVFDYDGSELVHYPNDFTRIRFSRLAKSDEGYQELLDRMKRKEIFVLWISFPHEKPIHPKEARIVRLVYFDDKNPKSVKWSIFSIPRYIFDKITPPDETYNTFWNVTPPSGYRLRHKTLEATKTVGDPPEKLTRADGLFIDLTDCLISIRIPFLPAVLKYSMAYTVELPVAEVVFLEVGLLLLLISSILVAIAPFPTLLTVYLAAIIRLILEYRNSIAGAIVATCIAIIGFLNDPLTKRTRLLLLVPILILVLGYII
jgi:hypothetical protein